jgi:hypothetical protein
LNELDGQVAEVIKEQLSGEAWQKFPIATQGSKKGKPEELLNERVGHVAELIKEKLFEEAWQQLLIAAQGFIGDGEKRVREESMLPCQN